MEITYVLTSTPPVPADMAGFVGKPLTGGYPTKIGDVPVVRFLQRIRGQQVALRYDTRPDLAVLVEEWRAARAAEDAAHQARWAAEKAAKAERDAPLLAAMETEAARLRGLIPADHVEVTATETGHFDGMPIVVYAAEGVRLTRSDITRWGVAAAIRPGALNAFATVEVVSIAREDLERLRAEQAERAAQAAAEKAREAARIEAARQKAAETGVPQVLACEVVDGDEDFDYLYTEIDAAGRISERRDRN